MEDEVESESSGAMADVETLWVSLMMLPFFHAMAKHRERGERDLHREREEKECKRNRGERACQRREERERVNQRKGATGGGLWVGESDVSHVKAGQGSASGERTACQVAAGRGGT